MEVNIHFLTPTALFPCPLNTRLGEPWNQYGGSVYYKKSRAPVGKGTAAVPARSGAILTDLAITAPTKRYTM